MTHDTRPASSTSSIANTLPAYPIQRGGRPQEPNRDGRESDPRARSDNAQPHHRLPGSNSKTGSLKNGLTAPRNTDLGERPHPIFPHARASRGTTELKTSCRRSHGDMTDIADQQ